MIQLLFDLSVATIFIVLVYDLFHTVQKAYEIL
jgi:hypothetical protein